MKRQEILDKETPSQCETRLNRERKHPTKSADVFVWAWSTDESMELVRTRVSKREREDILESHSKEQCIYDSVFNTWDVCEYFGPESDYNDNDNDVDNYGGGGDKGSDDMDVDGGAKTDRDTVDAYIKERIDKFNNRCFTLPIAPSSDRGPEVDLTHDANHVDILKYMSDFYGFVHPLPIPETDSVPIVQKDWDESLKSVGLQSGIHPQPPGLAGPIVNFIMRLQGLGGGPQEFEWDILPGNRQALNPESIVKYFHKPVKNNDEKLFIVDGSFLADGNLTDWKIALTTSGNALYTLRSILGCSQNPSSASLARHLAEEGIPFYTILKLDHFPSSIDLNGFTTRIPRRGANYRFTMTDFDSYVAERKQLLSTPRARAAILQGGIVGRLAKEHLDVESVTSGPSSSVTAHRLGYTVKIDGDTY